VTAGAAGIGLAIVQSFLAQGYRVATCDIDADAVQQLRAEYPDVAASTCDVSDDHADRQWVDDAVAALGRTVVLVSNAGIAGPTAEVADHDLADWSRVIDVNLTGAFLVARAAIPHLRRAGGGSVVFMSSLAGRMGYPNRAAYSAGKWGVIGLAKTLARELGPDGIRVDAVLPGAVAGPRWDRVIDGRAAESGRSRTQIAADSLGNQSIRELVTPKDVAELVT
jgi:NAD(P)-dependent dehydrogenase (short-subunit alcohol dehydrogenase family)